MKRLMALASPILLSSTVFAAQYKDTAVDRCSTKNAGRFSGLSFKIDQNDKAKALVIGLSEEGDCEALTGKIVRRTSKIDSTGVRQTSTTVKLEDGKVLKTVEFGDTSSTASLDGQKFECGD